MGKGNLMAALSAAVYQGDVYPQRPPHRGQLRNFEGYVRVNIPSSSWADELSGRLNELTSLPRGWDGYFAPPIPFTNAAFAAALIDRLCIAGIEAPQIVPGNDGRLQIEWHSGGFDIELEVTAPYKVYASRENIRSGEVEEEFLASDFSVLSRWLSELSAAQQVEVAVG